MVIRHFKLSLLAAAYLLVFTACKRYEDGPAISFRSAKTRLCNTWTISTAIQNGQDQSSGVKYAYTNFKIEIKKDGHYTASYRPFNTFDYREDGTWTFSDNNTKVNFTKTSADTGDQMPAGWKILRLKEKELWAEQRDSSNVVEMHMKPE